MKRETKLWLRKRVLMALRVIVWRVDEWLHRQEVRLREEIQAQTQNTRLRAASQAAHLPVRVRVEPARASRPQRASVSSPVPFPSDEFLLDRIRGRVSRSGESQRIKKTRRRGMTAADFDRRFA